MTTVIYWVVPFKQPVPHVHSYLCTCLEFIYANMHSLTQIHIYLELLKHALTYIVQNPMFNRQIHTETVLCKSLEPLQFQEARLSCDLSKLYWTIILQAFRTSLKGHSGEWFFCSFVKPIKTLLWIIQALKNPHLTQGDKLVLCLHIADSLAKNQRLLSASVTTSLSQNTSIVLFNQMFESTINAKISSTLEYSWFPNRVISGKFGMV